MQSFFMLLIHVSLQSTRREQAVGPLNSINRAPFLLKKLLIKITWAISLPNWTVSLSVFPQSRDISERTELCGMHLHPLFLFGEKQTHKSIRVLALKWASPWSGCWACERCDRNPGCRSGCCWSGLTFGNYLKLGLHLYSLLDAPLHIALRSTPSRDEKLEKRRTSTPVSALNSHRHSVRDQTKNHIARSLRKPQENVENGTPFWFHTEKLSLDKF